MTGLSTIAAISTPLGTGGVGIIRISGKSATEIADKIFVSVSGKKLADSKGYRAHFGKIFDRENAENNRCVADVDNLQCRLVDLLNLQLFVKNNKPVRRVAHDCIREALRLILKVRQTH